MILAGGEGNRLGVLSGVRAKPAVPFGGKYRIIDFTLSNCVNSGIDDVLVLTQYNPRSLNDHIGRGRAWDLDRTIGGVRLLQPQVGRGNTANWYSGTADAVLQNLREVVASGADTVLVLAGDHIYKMDYELMLQQHVNSGADVTIGCLEVPRMEATGFGVMHVDESDRIVSFIEKPKDPPPMPGRPDMALASMGNYLFKTDVLVREVVRDAARGGVHDFGRSIIAEFFRDHRVMVYDFATNVVPGQTERERGYWRDVGTLDAYWDAHMDLVAVTPIFNLYNREWPIRTYYQHLPAAKFVFDDDNRRGMAVDSMIASGSIVSGAHIKHSLLFNDVRVESGSQIRDSVILHGVVIGRNCRIERAIVDANIVDPADEKFIVSGQHIRTNHQLAGPFGREGPLQILRSGRNPIEVNRHGARAALAAE